MRSAHSDGDHDEIRDSGGSTKSTSTRNLLIAGGVVVVLFMILRQRSAIPADQNLNGNDYDLVNANTPSGSLTLLAEDKSPVFFTAKSGMTASQLLVEGERISAKWTGRIESIADKMLSTSPAIGAGIALLLNSTSGSVSERAIDIYLRLMEQYSVRVSAAVTATTDAVADIAIATISGISDAENCIETTFIKEVSETSEYSAVTTNTATVKNGGGSAIFGLFASKRSIKTVQTQVAELTVQDRNIRFIPVCTSWGLDVAAVDALFAVQHISVVIAYSALKSVLDTAPNAAYFVDTRPR